MKKLLSVNADYKTTKGLNKGYLTGILYMLPDFKTCPSASKGCMKACLQSAGRGAFNNVQAARKAKKELFYNNKHEFFKILIKDIQALVKKAKRENLIPVVRLNGTSDIAYENERINTTERMKNIFELFPEVQFYDYTKRLDRTIDGIPNYNLTLSRSETNENAVLAKLDKHNVAIVFAGKELPKQYRGIPVINGDETDLRFLDDRNVIVGLTAKGKAKKDDSGFVVKGVL